MAEDATKVERDGAFWADCMERIANDRDKQSFMMLFDHFSPRVNAYLLGQGVEEVELHLPEKDGVSHPMGK